MRSTAAVVQLRMPQHVCDAGLRRNLSPGWQLRHHRSRQPEPRNTAWRPRRVRCRAYGPAFAAQNGMANGVPASAVITPHSGYHFDGLRQQFFEGWYWKVRCEGALAGALACIRSQRGVFDLYEGSLAGQIALLV